MNITIIQGHPDGGGHLCHALADAYCKGALVESVSPKRRARWLANLEKLGLAAR